MVDVSGDTQIVDFPVGTKERLISGIIENEHGCWIWQKSVGGYGYGQMSVRGYPVSTHRLSHELFNGPIPPGTLVCHSCDVKLCVNPGHLWLGSNLDNTRDCVAKGRNAHGEKNGQSRISAKDALEIIDLYVNGMTTREIGARFNMGHGAIFDIVRGKRWIHLEGRPAIETKKVGGRPGVYVGERHSQAKLKSDDVLLIRQMRADGTSRIELANKFGVSPRTITDVCNRKSWTHI